MKSESMDSPSEAPARVQAAAELPAADPSAATGTPEPSAPPPSEPLFRTTAMQRLSSPDRLDIAASIVGPRRWLLMLAAVVPIVGALIASVLIRIPVKVDAEGVLFTTSGVREVASATGGQLKSLIVRIGDRVLEGDVVAQVEQPDLKQEVELAVAELDDGKAELQKKLDIQNRIKLTQDDLRARQRAAWGTSMQFVEKRMIMAGERIRNAEELAREGYGTRQKVLDVQVEIGSLNEEKIKLNNQKQEFVVDEARAQSERERETLAEQIKVAAAERKLQQMQARMNRTNVVKSAFSGTVVEIKVNEGEIVERGAPLIILIPESVEKPGAPRSRGFIPLVATLYVAGVDGKRVQPGMAVQLQPENIKREEDGYVLAKVASVAQIAATQEGMTRALKNVKTAQSLSAAGAPFEIKAELELDPTTVSGFKWSTSRGPDSVLTTGTPCKAKIVVRSDLALVMLMPPLRQVMKIFE